MKKKILSPAALAKIVTKPKEEENAAATAADIDTETEEAAVVDTAAAGEEQEAEASADDAVVAELTTKLAAAEEEAVALKAELDEVKAKAEADLAAAKAAADEALKPFAGIVADITASMRVAMSFAEVDLSALAPEALLKEYNSTQTAFAKAYPVGGVTTGGEEVRTETNANHFGDSVSAGQLNALGF